MWWFRENPAILNAVVIVFLLCPVCFPGEGSPEEEMSQEIEAMFTNMWRLAQAADGFRFDHGEYPPAATIEEFVEKVRRPYLLSQEVFLDDAWGYKILVSSDGETIEIRSVGSDGIFEDDAPGGMTSTLESDIVIRNREYTEFVQYPLEYCDQCPPNFCNAVPSEAEDPETGGTS
ncbi:MAG: type II secretion system protein GspG [Thermoanaerobaculales bacterium]|jgi:hypothetical protein|nr:type II secretion system protein GspG [Thermoanaerobaculales bacterium]